MDQNELAVLRTLHANERTYLAWLRTCVAMLAFGFVLEKFRFFAKYIGMHEVGALDRELSALGMGMFAIGVLLLLVATWRFVKTRRRILGQTETKHPRAEAMLFYTALFAITALVLIIAFYSIR